MSDIKYAFDHASHPLANFDTWLKVSRNLGHFWSGFSDDVMSVIRAVFAKGGWSAVNAAVRALAVLSPWHMSYVAMGGIMPPTGPDHLHTTSTGRLEISVTEDGHILTNVFRLVGGERVEIGRFLDQVNTWRMPQMEWEELGGKDEVFSERHRDAVNEVLKYV